MFNFLCTKKSYFDSLLLTRNMSFNTILILSGKNAKIVMFSKSSKFVTKLSLLQYHNNYFID